MQNNQTNLPAAKGRGMAIFENILLIVCLCVSALRTCLTEIPFPQSSENIAYHSWAAYSLTLSIILIAAFVVWLVFKIRSDNFSYRTSFIEVGLFLLLIASAVASLYASNARAAITNIIVFTAPAFMAILLVQILKTDLKIKLALAVIAAAGFINVCQSADQFSKSNDEVIREYKENPQQVLDTLGIEAGSLDQFQLEHRLYSKDVAGYFTTSNSAGSFYILAIFAAAVLLIEKIKNRKTKDFDPWHIITSAIITVAILAGLFLTRSKGAIAAFVLAVILFAAIIFLGRQLYNHRKKMVIILILLAAAAAFAIISYGLSHNRLPGGNSMLVRWQYWRAAADIYKDYPLTGVGPGNFANAFFHHKPPESIESVSDPHNFLLSILVQYGPAGLVAFLLIIGVPLYKIARVPVLPLALESGEERRKFNKVYIALAVAAVLLVVRPFASPLSVKTSSEWVASSIFIYVIPAAAFLIGFMLITSGPQENIIFQRKEGQANYPYVTVAALFSSVIGLLIHNLADFAIFEPGVLTALFCVLGCLISTDLNSRQPSPGVCRAVPVCVRRKGIVTIVSIAGFAGLLYFGLFPVASSISKVAAARKASVEGQFSIAYAKLDEADKDDPLNPLSPSLYGRFYISEFVQNRRTELLVRASSCFEQAIRCDKSCYKDYERLGNLYLLLAQTDQESKRGEWLNKSFITTEQAVLLFPASDRVRFFLAEVAVMLGKKDAALENYILAVQFEDAFRGQFKKMYPGWKSAAGEFSRLGQPQYERAKKQIELLSK
jgi:tetratricopeptide (TPR) repeat protein